MATKIATCSYCNTRAALVLDKGLHELTCRACGAPLHDMKFMPQPVEKVVKRSTSKAREETVRQLGRKSYSDQSDKQSGSGKKRSKRRRKPLTRRILEEVWDVVEDIFD